MRPSRIYDTTPEDLWNALTSPERISSWFLPVSGELRLGGRYQFEGNAGGTISVCEPPNGLAATWEFGGAVSWVIVRLQAEDGGTRLTLEHLAEPGDETWTKFGPGAVGVGWDLTFLCLGQHPEGELPSYLRKPWPGPLRRARPSRAGAPRIGAALRSCRAGRNERHCPGGADGGGLHRRHGRLMHAFDVLGDPVRRRILELLAESEHASGEVAAAVQAEYGITQSAVSQHLKVLRDAGFATVRADGARRIYAVDSGPPQAVDGWLERFRGFGEPKLEALATEVAPGKPRRPSTGAAYSSSPAGMSREDIRVQPSGFSSSIGEKRTL